MVKLSDISLSFDSKVIDSFSYEFPDRGLVLIRGASGKGKTTLLRIMAGLICPTEGVVEGMEGKAISCVFQEARLVPHLTLLENILLVKKKPDREKALALLQKFGLEKDKNKFPTELSGGMALRGAIARSLYYGGDVYLWDEPTKELDPDNRKKVIEAIEDISKKALAVVVTHDPSLSSPLTIEL